jgi:hypothetical protein
VRSKELNAEGMPLCLCGVPHGYNAVLIVRTDAAHRQQKPLKKEHKCGWTIVSTPTDSTDWTVGDLGERMKSPGDKVHSHFFHIRAVTVR